MIRLISAYPRHDTLRRLDQKKKPTLEWKIRIGDEQYSWKALIFQPLISVLEINPTLVKKLTEINKRQCSVEDIFQYYLDRELRLAGKTIDILEICALAKHYKVSLRLPDAYVEQLKDLYTIPDLVLDEKRVIRSLLKYAGITMKSSVSKITSAYDFAFDIPEEQKTETVIKYSQTA